MEEPKPFLIDQTRVPSSPSPSCWQWPSAGGSAGSLGTCERPPCCYISPHYLTAERLASPADQRLDSSEIMLALNNSTGYYWDVSEYSQYP